MLSRLCAMTAAVCVTVQSVPLTTLLPLAAQEAVQGEEQQTRLVNIASLCEITAPANESGRGTENLTDGDLSTLYVTNGAKWPCTIEFKLPSDNTRKIKKVAVKFEEGHSAWSVDVRLSHVINSVIEDPILDLKSADVNYDDGFEYTFQDGILPSHLQVELSNPKNAGAAGAFWPAAAEIEIWAEEEIPQAGDLINVASRASVTSCGGAGNPDNLTDGNYNTLYVFNNGGISTIDGECWVEAALGKNYAVKSLEVAFEQKDPDTNGFEFTFDVYGKSSGQSEWNLLFENQKAKRLAGENIVELPFEEMVSLSDFRLVITSIKSTGGDPWPAFAEFKIFALEDTAQTDTDPYNIAYNKPVHANLGAATADRITDGNTASAWSADRYPAYADIDLEANYALEDVRLFLNTNGVLRYSIYTSKDGSNYSLAFRTDDDVTCTSEGNVHAMNGVEARYVRLYMEYQSVAVRPQVREVRVHGTPTGNPIETAPAISIDNFSETEYAKTPAQADTIAEVQGIVSRRLGEQYVSWFDFSLKDSVSGYDEFDLTFENGKVHISGNDGVSLATGLNHYLKYYCNVQISEMVEQVKMPDSIVAFEGTIHRQTPMKVRYAYNYCTHSYSMAFYGEDEWRNELDWLALNGVNVVLDLTGQEEVWRRFLIELGYTNQEAKDFVTGPAYAAWFNMANMSGLGGPIHDKHFENRTELARKNHQIMERLGMQPAVQGYCGMVPTDIKQKDPSASVIAQGTWTAVSRPSMLRTDSECFARYAQTFYKVQQEVFGDRIHYYATDPFHEGGNTGGMSPAVISSGVMDQLLESDDQGVWIIQSWGANPTPGLIQGLAGRQDHALVLDLYAEKQPRWQNTSNYGGKEFGGTPWVYCMLSNFGGRMGLYGHMDNFASQVASAYENAEHMTGIGITPEASLNNPILYDMFFETAWTEDESLHAIEPDAWLEAYARRAYGAESEAAAESVKILRDTVYKPELNMKGQGAPENVINARPAASITAASSWGNSIIDYDKTELERALQLLIEDYDLLKDSEAYQYDLAVLAQQVISNTAQEYHKKMASALEKGDAEAFDLYSDRFLNLIDFSERVQSTQSSTMVGTWIENAMKMSEGTDDFFRDLTELNAKSLVTTWGSIEQANSGGLHDYSNRQWAGLTKDYYKPRWEAWIAEQKKRLAGESYKNFSSADWFAMEWKWTTGHTKYSSQPSDEDLKTISQIILNDYSVAGIPKEPEEDDSRDIDLSLLQVSAGSEQSGYASEGPASLVLDNNTTTIWHTKWAGDSDENLWIQLSLEDAAAVSGLRLLPRQNGTNGMITEYRIEGSSDHGETWNVLASGTWAANSAWKLVEWQEQDLTDVRLYAVKNSSDQNVRYASAAEIRLISSAKEEVSSDKRLLEMAVKKAQETELNPNLHPKVKANFEKALSDAQRVLADSSADQAAVDATWQQLAAAIHMLSFTQDKSGLQALVDECAALDLGQYEDDEAKTAFEAALAQAEAVLADEDALDETSIQPALAALSQAKAALTPKAEEDLDLSVLRLLVESTQDTDLDRYLSDGAAVFAAALEEAGAVLASPESQSQVDEAVNTLHQAWMNLRLKADESLLEQLRAALAALEAADPAVYSTNEELASRFAAFKEKAELLLAAPEAAADEVSALIDESRTLLADTKTQTVSRVDVSKADNQKPAASVKTSAATNSGWFAAAGAAALGMLALLKKRRK